MKAKSLWEQRQDAKNRKAKGKGEKKMMVPIRCFSCGKQLGSLYEEFKKKVSQGEKPEKAMDELGIKRYCCRRIIFSQVDLIDEISKFKS